MHPDNKTLLSMYEVMTTVRQCEDRLRSLLMSGQIALTIHAPRGQEAIAAGLGQSLRPDDYLVTTYRGMHDHIAKGVSLRKLWAEYLGRSTGACGGKGGPMHITDIDSGVMLTTGIVGGGIPIANGLALASQLQGSDRVTVCCFGDGASNIGAFHEALNLAQLWRLPVVFVCQNNLWAEHTLVSDHQVNANVSDRAAAYAMVGVTVDGTDPVLMLEAMQTAVDRARRGEGPTLVEAVAYRGAGHYLGDSADYVPQEWLDMAAAKDPVPVMRARVLVAGFSEEDLQGIEQRIESDLDDAVEFALNSPFPDLGELARDIYAPEAAV